MAHTVCQPTAPLPEPGQTGKAGLGPDHSVSLQLSTCRTQMLCFVFTYSTMVTPSQSRPRWLNQLPDQKAAGSAAPGDPPWQVSMPRTGHPDNQEESGRPLSEHIRKGTTKGKATRPGEDLRQAGFSIFIQDQVSTKHLTVKRFTGNT